MGEKLTAGDAAKKMGLSRRCVNQFIQEGRLKAERFGNAWMLEPKDVEAFLALDRPSGVAGHWKKKPAAKSAGRKGE